MCCSCRGRGLKVYYRYGIIQFSSLAPSLVPRLPRPSGKNDLVFKVRILGIFVYVNHVILAGPGRWSEPN